MIELATQQDARREIARRRTYSGRGFGPRSFECIGINIGIGVGNSPTPSAPTFNGNFGALFTGVVQYLRSDLGLTKTGSVVNAWADQSGNGWNVAEGTSTVGIGNATTGLNGHAGIVGGTGGQYGKITGLTFPVASATPTFYWGVARLVTSPGGQGWLTTGSTSGGEFLLYANSGANLTNYNGNLQSAATLSVGSWGRLEAQFNNAANDYVKFAATVNANGASGNIAPTANHYLFASPTGTNPGNWELLTLLTLNNIPSGAQLSAASAAAQSFYGVSVGI